MDSLVKSPDPLLALAGAFFLIGATLDAVFSKKFKRQIRKAILGGTRSNFVSIIASYAVFFISDIVAPSAKSVFVLKALILSVVFYILMAIAQLYYFKEFRQPLMVHTNFLLEIAQFSPLVIVVLLHAIFDIFSAYVCVLYLRLLSICPTLRLMILTMISNLIVLSMSWALFFAIVLAIQLKIADSEVRSTTVGLMLVSEPLSSWEAPLEKNKSLVAPKTMKLQLFYVAPWSPAFEAASMASRPFFYTNIEGDKQIAGLLFDLVLHQESGRIWGSAIEPSEENFHAFEISIQDAIHLDDIPWVVGRLLVFLSPTRMLTSLTEFNWLTTSFIFHSLHPDYYKHNFWNRGQSFAVYCNDKLKVVSFTELEKFDFSKCKTYLVAHEAISRYITLVAGADLNRNSFVSHWAFFMSSMAVIIAFYLVLFAMALLAAGRQVFATQFGRGIFNMEKVFFTPLFSAVSVMFLAAFVIATAVRMISS